MKTIFFFQANEPWRNFAPLSAAPGSTQFSLRVASYSSPLDIRFQAEDYTDSFDMDAVPAPALKSGLVARPVADPVPAPMPLVPIAEPDEPDLIGTPLSSPYDSTSESVVSSTGHQDKVEGISSKLEELFKILPWLSSIYNATEDTIALPDGE